MVIGLLIALALLPSIAFPAQDIEPLGPPVPVGQDTEAAVLVPEPDAWTTVGARIPDLQLPLIDRKSTFDLASLRGKRVLLIQFASW